MDDHIKIEAARRDIAELQVLVIQGFAKLERMLNNATPPSRRTYLPGDRVAPISTDRRKNALLQNFFGMTDMPRANKLHANYPQIIVQQVGPEGEQPPWRIIVKSILLNRCSQRKLFAPDFTAGETSSMDCVKETLQALCDAGTLAVTTIAELTRGRSRSLTEIVYDPSVVPEELSRPPVVGALGTKNRPTAEILDGWHVMWNSDGSCKCREIGVDKSQETAKQKKDRLTREKTMAEHFASRRVKAYLEVPVEAPVAPVEAPAEDEEDYVPPAAVETPAVKQARPKYEDDDEEDYVDPKKINTTPEIVDIIVDDVPKKKKGKGGWVIEC